MLNNKLHNEVVCESDKAAFNGRATLTIIADVKNKRVCKCVVDGTSVESVSKLCRLAVEKTYNCCVSSLLCAAYRQNTKY